MPEQPAQQTQAESKAQPKLKSITRQQTTMATIYVEELIPADHKARAILELAGKMDLSKFHEPLRTTAGYVGLEICRELKLIGAD